MSPIRMLLPKSPFPTLLLAVASFLTLPAAHAAPDGARLYARHCAACHGAEGSGGVGVPLSQPDLLATVDDQYLRLSIRHGRPGRVMPAFKQLSDAEVNAIVRHMRSWAKDRAAPVPVKVGKGNAARGEKLYAQYCAACHGANGEGGHGTGVTFSRPRDLAVLAPALNNPGYLAAASDTVIKATLVRGRDGTPMQSFLKQGLKEPDIDDIVAFVRSFGKQQPAKSAKIIAAEAPILQRVSPYSVEETTTRVKDALQRINMRIIRSVSFDQGMVDVKEESPKRWIVDGCDFGYLNKALAVDPRVGLFLPCRVTIAEHQGKVRVMTINPKRLSSIFNNSELNQMCEEMHQLYNDLLDEVVL
jgi:cytochrome c oxidase cbb3-type subunit 3